MISPSVTKKMFKTAVKITIGTIGFKLFKTIVNGILETQYVTIRKKIPTESPIGFEAIKSITTYAIVSRIFALGSSLCIKELPGKYCPNVISLSTILSSFLF